MSLSKDGKDTSDNWKIPEPEMGTGRTILWNEFPFIRNNWYLCTYLGSEYNWSKEEKLVRWELSLLGNKDWDIVRGDVNVPLCTFVLLPEWMQKYVIDKPCFRLLLF